MEGPLALTTAAVRSSVLTYGGFDESTDVTTKIKDMAPSIVKGTSKVYQRWYWYFECLILADSHLTRFLVTLRARVEPAWSPSHRRRTFSHHRCRRVRSLVQPQ